MNRLLDNGTVLHSTSDTGDDIYVETPKNAFEIKDDDHDDEGDVEENVKSFGMKHYGEISSPYLGPYLSKRDCSISNTVSGEMAIILRLAILP